MIQLGAIASFSKCSTIFGAAFLLLLSCSADNCNESGSILPMGQISYDSIYLHNPGTVDLGRKLFFDERLSVNNALACASCHLPALAFTDGRKKAVGIKGNTTMRNAPTLLNVGYQPHFMFDGAVPTLEMQALVPLKDTNEMGNDIQQLIEKLRHVPEYQQLAKSLYGREFDAFVLTRALGSFQRSLISQNSPFDQWFYHADEHAVSGSVKNGYRIFSDKLYCASCHPAPTFTTYDILSNGRDSLSNDEGLYRITGLTKDIGKFKIPTLRNIALTGPYMHDGSVQSLREVIHYYAKGGDGHPNQDQRIISFDLSDEEVKDLLDFFESLTDTSLITSN